jgi:hypothetical protein
MINVFNYLRSREAIKQEKNTGSSTFYFLAGTVCRTPRRIGVFCAFRIVLDDNQLLVSSLQNSDYMEVVERHAAIRDKRG